MSVAGRTVLLIGGGRWGRVHASNLSRLLEAKDRLIWVSQHNRSALADSIRAWPVTGPAVVLADFDAALGESATAAIVVTAPETHAAVARACLSRGLHTFVEKPLALTSRDARELVDIASGRGCILAVGLHLLSAGYLAHFAGLLHGRKIARIEIRWFDPPAEDRYGERKQVDFASSPAHDIYPHVWSIVYRLTSERVHHVEQVDWEPGGTVVFETSAGAVRCVTRSSRRAAVRERKLAVELHDGGCATLDFSEEPGIAVLDGVTRPSDPSWNESARPVAGEIARFLAEIAASTDWPQRAADCIDSVVSAEALAEKLYRCEEQALELRIAGGAAHSDDRDTTELVLGLLAPAFAVRGVRLAALDASSQSLLVAEALRRIARHDGASVRSALTDDVVIRSLMDFGRVL